MSQTALLTRNFRFYYNFRVTIEFFFNVPNKESELETAAGLVYTSTLQIFESGEKVVVFWSNFDFFVTRKMMLLIIFKYLQVWIFTK